MTTTTAKPFWAVTMPQDVFASVSYNRGRDENTCVVDGGDSIMVYGQSIPDLTDALHYYFDDERTSALLDGSVVFYQPDAFEGDLDGHAIDSVTNDTFLPRWKRDQIVLETKETATGEVWYFLTFPDGHKTQLKGASLEAARQLRTHAAYRLAAWEKVLYTMESAREEDFRDLRREPT